MSDIAEWLRKEAQRHSQCASDKAFTSRRRSTFKHRSKKLREAADALEQKDTEILNLRDAIRRTSDSDDSDWMHTILKEALLYAGNSTT